MSTALHPHTSKVNQLHFFCCPAICGQIGMKVRLHPEAVSHHRFVTPQVLSRFQGRLVSCSVSVQW